MCRVSNVMISALINLVTTVQQTVKQLQSKLKGLFISIEVNTNSTN